MPQLSRKHENRNIPLSDHEVNLLWDIVSRAEARAATTQRPLAALWNIYDSTSATAKLDDAADKRFFDFLVNFSLPDYRGRPLLETLRVLLREQDIIIENTEDPQAQEVERPLATHDGYGVSSIEEEDESRRPTRRVSFTSLYDTTREIERQLEVRPFSRASVSKLEMDRSALPRPNESRKWTRRQLEHPTPLLRGTAATDVNTNDQGNAINRHFSPRRPRSPTTNDRQHWKSLAEDAISEDWSIEPSDANPDTSPSSEASYHPHYSREPFYVPAKADIARYADVFVANRESAFLRQTLGRWNRKALGLLGERYYWEYRAAEKDRKKLLGEAMSAWRAVYRERAQAAKLERFYEHLSRRADFARDLYLVGRAFSHWLVIATDRVEETHIARRHLLRLKYFNTWRDITAMQELKAQRLGMKRPLKLLLRGYATRLESQAYALTVYHRNLTKVVFYRWFYALCEKNAPKYRDRHLTKDSLMYWSHAFRMRIKQQFDADDMYQRRVTTRAFSTWAQKTRIDLGGNHQADGFRRGHFLRGVFDKWHVEAKLQPLANQIGRMQDWRVARTFFGTWLQRARGCLKADMVDHLRIKQDAWTAWNDKLRVYTIASQINERLQVQALYQWVLAERARLLRRSCDQRIMKNAFQKVLSHFRKKSSDLHQQEAQAVTRHQQTTLRSVLDRWKLRVFQQRVLESVAIETCRDRLQRKCLRRLRENQGRVQHLNAHITHAEFYLLTLKVIKWWRSATIESHKKKRQEAYATIRRLVKVNMAGRAFAAWKRRLKHVQDLNDSAVRRQETRSVGISSQHLSNWRTRSFLISQLYGHATKKHDRRIQVQCTQSWIQKMQHHSRLEDEAANFQRIHVLDLCSALLRRISLRAFEIRCRDVNAEATADATQERHWKNHFRKILRYWAERAAREASLVPAADDDDVESPTTRRARPLFPDGMNFTANRLFDTSPPDPRAAKEEWTPLRGTEGIAFPDLGDGFPPTPSDVVLPLPPPPSTPQHPPLAQQQIINTPAYLLSTPSNRAARARALANISTTPATPVRTPFAVRIFRDAQSAPPLAKARKEGDVGKGKGKGKEKSNLGQYVSSSDDTGTQE